MYGIFIFLMVIATIALTIGWTLVFTYDKVKKEVIEDVKTGSVKMYALAYSTVIMCVIWTIIIIK